MDDVIHHLYVSFVLGTPPGMIGSFTNFAPVWRATNAGVFLLHRLLHRALAPERETEGPRVDLRACLPPRRRACKIAYVKAPFLFALLFTCSSSISSSASQSVARVWDEATLQAIRTDTPNPPVHARNLFHLSVAMYDAWAAYDPIAVGYLFHEKHSPADVAAARNEAISYAAWRLLKERYAYSVNATNTLPALDAQMVALGYDTNNLSTDTSTAAGVGNRIYAAVSAYFIDDGSLQTAHYQDPSYAPVNLPLVTGWPGDTNVTDVNHWQPLAITNSFDQHGYPAGLVQKFIGSQWLGVRPFALERLDASQPWFDPGPQPHLNGTNDLRFRSDVIDVLRRSGELAPDDGVLTDTSPASLGNNTLGANDGTGYRLNPITGMPYATNLVPRGDFGRVVAEFWADGPNSETPPGHWNVIANQVADNPNTVKRIGGKGPLVDDLEWDVKMYFALNGAVHDAACAAWSLKRYYDGGRPIEYIRYMGQCGQCSDTASASFDTNGLPLLTNVVELVTTNTAAPGGRHEGLPVGRVVIYAWPGPPADPTNQHSGVHWMLTDPWLPYQKASFVTPSFPGYISGHSTFSRSAAEVLTAMTHSPFFPGGLGSFTAPANTFLKFENGPSQSVRLQWATYYDASDQAGISRLWGGIHVSIDDLTGRVIGSKCGQAAWALASSYFDGSILNRQAWLTLDALPSGEVTLRYNTLRGFYYSLHTTTNLMRPLTLLGSSFQAVDSSITFTDAVSGSMKFYRVVRSLSPEIKAPGLGSSPGL